MLLLFFFIITNRQNKLNMKIILLLLLWSLLVFSSRHRLKDAPITPPNSETPAKTFELKESVQIQELKIGEKTRLYLKIPFVSGHDWYLINYSTLLSSSLLKIPNLTESDGGSHESIKDETAAMPGKSVSVAYFDLICESKGQVLLKFGLLRKWENGSIEERRVYVKCT